MIIKKSKWFDVMNFKGVTCLILCQVAGLASAIISLASFSALAVPGWAIVLFIAAAPARVILTRQIFRLPLPHTFPATKVVFFNLRVLAFKFLFAPITFYSLDTTPVMITKA